ncbi:MAG TPA: hypothetical protein VMW17_22780 [Candidatus Binatia bacterium]|nr:hypothetical protein [Candidatus Binatia bacterium]
MSSLRAISSRIPSFAAAPGRWLFGGMVGLVLSGLILPAAAHAQKTCNGQIEIGYSNIPAFNTINSVDTVVLTLGAGGIGLGGDPTSDGQQAQLTINKIFFDLDCKHKSCVTGANTGQGCSTDADCNNIVGACQSLLPGTCVDDGVVMGFYNTAIQTTCTGITFTPESSAGNPGVTSPNEIVFDLSPSLTILHDTANFCTVTFQIQKRSLVSFDDTPLVIEQRAGFTVATCNNGPLPANNLTAAQIATGSLDIDPTPTPTNTPTLTATATPTFTPTNTPTQTATFTPTNTPTQTPTFTPTRTPTNTPTRTPTNTPTLTPTNSPPPTSTPPPTNTRPPIPVVPTPTSPAGVVMIIGLGGAIAYSLRRFGRVGG